MGGYSLPLKNRDMFRDLKKGFQVGNYILFCTISKTIKGHMIMYPFIILYNSAMITFSQKVDL